MREVVGLSVSRANRVRVDQVEDLTHVDDEAFLALADEDTAGSRAARNADVIHEVAGIRGVVWNRFLTDVIDRLVEDGAAESGVLRQAVRTWRTAPTTVTV